MLESAHLGGDTLLGVLVIFVSVFLVVSGHHLMMMLLRKNLLVADWLDSGMVVVLVNLTVHSLGDILMVM